MSLRHTLPSSLLVLGLALACDPKAATGAEASAPTDALKGDGNCAQFVNEVCAQSGEEASACSATREATKLLSEATCAAAMTDLAHTKEVLSARSERCTELVDKLCAELGAETQTCDLLRSADGPKDPSQCEAMLGDYATVLSEVQTMEAKNQPLPAEKLAQITKAGAPGFGPADAPVTLVEFSDFQCPYCSMAAAVVHRVEQEFEGKVRFVFRQYPLNFHPDAHLTSQASLAAHAQGKFWAFHDLVFANQEHLTRRDLDSYAERAELDMIAFKEALDSGTHAATVDAELKLGGEVFVNGTPSMFVNGKPVPNPTDYDSLAAMIRSELGT